MSAGLRIHCANTKTTLSWCVAFAEAHAQNNINYVRAPGMVNRCSEGKVKCRGIITDIALAAILVICHVTWDYGKINRWGNCVSLTRANYNNQA